SRRGTAAAGTRTRPASSCAARSRRSATASCRKSRRPSPLASRPDPSGALLVDKPPGPTSHDVVAFVRRTLGTSRVGHTGTLDPLATGLLVVLVGHGTRMAQFLAADEKEYVADVRLGIATPTYDAASLADAVRYPISDIRYPMDAEI